MKLKYESIIIVLAILAVVAVAGCTSTTSPSTSPATTTPGGATTAPGTVTTAPAAGGLTTLGSAIDYSKIHWFEYQMTTNAAAGGEATNMKMREDFNVDYQSAKANKVTMTMDTNSGGTAATTLITTYMDPTSGSSLGGHMTMSSGGQVLMDQDIPAGPAASTSPGTPSSQDPLQTYGGSTLTSAGAESVTVPAGTYAATKYTWTSADGSGTVWVAPSVPLPVKMTSNAAG